MGGEIRRPTFPENHSQENGNNKKNIKIYIWKSVFRPFFRYICDDKTFRFNEAVFIHKIAQLWMFTMIVWSRVGLTCFYTSQLRIRLIYRWKMNSFSEFLESVGKTKSSRKICFWEPLVSFVAWNELSFESAMTKGEGNLWHKRLSTEAFVYF